MLRAATCKLVEDYTGELTTFADTSAVAEEEALTGGWDGGHDA